MAPKRLPISVRSKGVGNVIAVRFKQDVAKDIAEIVFLPTPTGLNPRAGKAFIVENHTRAFFANPVDNIDESIKLAAAIAVLAQIFL